MNCSTPELPVNHQFPEFTQTHIHWISDAIQPSPSLPSPSPPTFDLSQYQGLFKLVSSSHQVAKVLEFVSTSVLPINIQDWFPLGLTCLISLQSKGLSRVPPIPQFKSINSSVLSFLYRPTIISIHDCWKNHSFDRMDLCQQSNVSAFYMISRLFIAFLPRSRCLLISWLQSPFTVILENKKIKSVTVSIVSLSICHEVMGPDAMILVFCWVLNQFFHYSLLLS